MAKQTRTTLKEYFQSGDVPTEAQFADLIDSELNITEDTLDDVSAGSTNKHFTSTEKDKLGTVEENADVTDTTNVDNAGATMNADSDVSGNSWVLDEDDFASDSAKKVPTQQSAKKYVDDKASLYGISVEDYGAKNGVICHEQLRDAVNAAGENGTLIFKPGSTYLQDDHVTPMAGQTWIGYGATLKRANARKTETTSGVGNGETEIPVTNASDFNVGDRIIVCNESATYDGKGAYESSYSESDGRREITSIDGNTITVDSGVYVYDSNGNRTSDYYPSGSPVVAIFWQTTSADNFTCIGLTFDGNKINNDYTWFNDLNRCVKSTASRVNWNQCRFLEMPSDAILHAGDGGWIRGCYGKNLNSSLVHWSSSIDENDQPINPSPKASFNHIVNCCIVPQDANRHNESPFTYSFNVRDVILTNNYIDGSGEGCFGDSNAGTASNPWNNNDSRAIVKNNIFKNTRYINKIDGFNGPILDYDISNNMFINCGDLTGSLSGLWKGYGKLRFRFNENTVINGRLYMLSAGYLKVLNNKFIIEDDFEGFDDSIAQSAHVSIGGYNIHFQGNELIARASSKDPNMTNGLYIPLTPVAVDEAGDDTDYYYTQQVKIYDNTFLNHVKSIFSNTGTVTTDRNKESVGFVISKNIIIPRKDDGGSTGLVLEPGQVAENNIIYIHSNGNRGAILQGVSNNNSVDGTTPLKDILSGPIFRNNTVYGSRSLTIALFGNNCVCTYNIVSGTNNYGEAVLGINNIGESTNVVDNNSQMVPNGVYPKIVQLHENSEHY